MRNSIVTQESVWATARIPTSLRDKVAAVIAQRRTEHNSISEYVTEAVILKLEADKQE